MSREADCITYFEGTWHDGNKPVLGPRHHAMWLSSIVFDGARAFDGLTPDLEHHCARINRSAAILGLEPTKTAEEVLGLAREGIARFEPGAHLYISPMYFAEDGFIAPDPASTRFVMTVFRAPMPGLNGFSACLSPFRRPGRDVAPSDAKASGLYVNVQRISADARRRGFDSAVVLDPAANVAEFGHNNLFMVKDGAVHTPAPNGTFLDGLTRQRVIALLRADGVEVVERAIAFGELPRADEVFATGNYAKITPCTRIEDHAIPVGPMFARARSLYMDFAGAGA